MANKKIETRPWDVTEHLRDDEDIRRYKEAAMVEAPNDAAFMAKVLGDVARARNISELNAGKRIMFLQIGDLLRQKFIHCSGNTPIPPYSKLANR